MIYRRFISALLLSGAPFPAQAEEREVARYEYTRAEMGVPFRIVLYGDDDAKARAAAKAAFDRVRALNAILSDYDPDSELSKLSATAGGGEAVKVSDDLWFLLKRSVSLADQTGGAFDVTAGPVVQLWRRARRSRKIPEPAQLAEALRCVGYKNLQLDPEPRTARLLVPGMRLDLGAIAKGYAADQALAVLREQGFSRAFVAASGDMAFGDPPPGRKGWRVEIAPLDVPDAPPTRWVVLANAGLATSGDVFQRVEIDGKRYSHIVDPRTGVGLTDHALVTVIARNATVADALSTAVSVLGPDAGTKLIESTPGAQVRIVRKPDQGIETRESGGFAKFYE